MCLYVFVFVSMGVASVSDASAVCREGSGFGLAVGFFGSPWYHDRDLVDGMGWEEMGRNGTWFTLVKVRVEGSVTLWGVAGGGKGYEKGKVSAVGGMRDDMGAGFHAHPIPSHPHVLFSARWSGDEKSEGGSK